METKKYKKLGFFVEKHGYAAKIALKYIGTWAVLSAVLTGASLGALYLNNRQYHGDVMRSNWGEEGKVLYIDKTDGVDGHTTLSLHEGGIEFYREGWGISGYSSTSYSDLDGDGLVDKIYLYPRNSSRPYNHILSLNRENDFDGYEYLFLDADRDYQEQKERFSEYLD